MLGADLRNIALPLCFISALIEEQSTSGTSRLPDGEQFQVRQHAMRTPPKIHAGPSLSATSTLNADANYSRFSIADPYAVVDRPTVACSFRRTGHPGERPTMA